MKFEENWPWGFREVVQRYGRADGHTNDGQGVITTVHPEPLAQVY